MEVDLQLRQEVEQAVRWMRSCLEEPEAAGKYRKLDCEYCPFDKGEGYCVDNMHIAVAELLEKLLAGDSARDAGDERRTVEDADSQKKKNPPVSLLGCQPPLGKGASVGADSSPTAQNDVEMGEEISAMDYLRSIGAIKDDGR